MMGVISTVTTSKLSSPQPTSVPTNTEQSVSEPVPTVTTSTDQSAVGAQIAVAVVPASTVTVIILLIMTLFLVGVGVYKRRNEPFQDTHRSGNLAAIELGLSINTSIAGIY